MMATVNAAKVVAAAPAMESKSESPASLVVETHGLTKRYGKQSVAVDNLTMTVRRGEVYGFLGPNGAGKTTTIRMLLGLIRPSAGSARILGAPPGSRASLARVGSMVETPSFYPYLSGRDNLRVLARYSEVNERRVTEALEVVGLTGRADDRFGTYSLGMKQRLGIGAALLKDPDLLILDEPTNGLDPQGVVEVRNLIRMLGSGGKSLLISSHLLSEVEHVADRVGIIQRGRLIAEGEVEEMRGGGGIAVRAEPRELAKEVLARFGASAPTEMEDGSLKVTVDPGDASRITKALIDQGVEVLEVRPLERTLEQVFLQLTSAEEVEA